MALVALGGVIGPRGVMAPIEIAEDFTLGILMDAVFVGLAAKSTSRNKLTIGKEIERMTKPKTVRLFN